MKSDTVSELRSALRDIEAGETSWQAANPPPRGQIFTPDDHDGALNPDRPVVVGNRGVGKSYWSAVLANDQLRRGISKSYPKLELNRLQVRLGFHEGAAGGWDNQAPSVADLARLENRGFSPFDIWRGVLVRILRTVGVPVDGLPDKSDWDAAVAWAADDTAAVEAALRAANARFQKRGEKFLILFDALDRLGDDWSEIRRRTEGILRLALQLRASRALRVKLFMRSDQFSDRQVFAFPDASKLRQDAVSLIWQRVALYGLLYHRLWVIRKDEVIELSGEVFKLPATMQQDIFHFLTCYEQFQTKFFYAISGEFMGAGTNRGRTYSWLHDHLADASGETSPRSFLLAIRKAAAEAQGNEFVLTPKSLQAGVQDASTVRLDQLMEDYWWVKNAITPLAGLLVPSEPDAFIDRWREKATVRSLLQDAKGLRRLPPVQLEGDPADPEARLLEELIQINVMERRTNGKINMPDIYRVAAGIKRKGGVRPPRPPGTA